MRKASDTHFPGDITAGGSFGRLRTGFAKQSGLRVDCCGDRQFAESFFCKTQRRNGELPGNRALSGFAK
jgi:hypothetical protein